MKHRKWHLTLGITAVLMLAGFLLWPKISMTSAGSVLAGQPLTLHFEKPVKEGVKAEEFRVMNGGSPVPATRSYSSDRKTLEIEVPKPGNYTVHVPGNSFSTWKRSAQKKISFNVIESVKPVSSAREIEEFFKQAKKQQQREKNEFTMETSSEDKASSDSAQTHSETNQQVEGVDEADLVKTDGDYLYDVTDTAQLVIMDIRDPQNLQIASATRFNERFYPRELYIDEDRLVIIGSRQLDRPSAVKDTMPMQELSVIRLYDVSDRSKPELLREAGSEGYVIGTRKIGPTVYMVTNNTPFYWIPDRLPQEDLIPQVYDSDENTLRPMELDRISILPSAMEPSYSVITALDIRSGDRQQVETKAYLGSSEQLYMSKENLYLTAVSYGPQGISTDRSEVFKFRLDGMAVDFAQAAELKGTILNQFSMDEHNGYFRAVTTEGNLWDEKNIAKNHLFILDADMRQVGAIEDLAKNERIYSARFMGDKAYMVTFRETDPLFVLDTSDPENPSVLGELKIPGFSNYLHPLGDRHLIGFGYETAARKNPQGGEPIIETRGMKISLFDVTDFHHPKEQAAEIIGGQGTYSAVQHDHHALFLHPERSLYGFPITTYTEDGSNGYLMPQVSGAMIYEITAAHGIRRAANLTEPVQGDYIDWESEVQRLLYSGNSVFAVSADEVKSYSIDSFIQLDKEKK